MLQSTERDARLPRYLVIGPGKSGTSWIHAYLEHRGDVVLPRYRKETFFFDRHWHRGLPWYASNFSASRCGQPVIEVAPTYFHCEAAPERILDALGRIPLLCTLRDPASRTYSLYTHLQRYGLANVSLRRAIQANPVLLESSRYATILRRWIDHFGRESLRFVFLEDLAAQPEYYAERVCASLDLSFNGLGPTLLKRVNEASVPPCRTVARAGKAAADVLRRCGMYSVVEKAKRLGLKPLFFGAPGRRPPALSPEDRQWLYAQLHEEIDQLEALLGIDLSHWKSPLREQAA